MRFDLRHLRWVNAALFLIQRFVNGATSAQIRPVSQLHPTLVTPAPYAFWIWSPIYTLVTLNVVVDCFCPVLSLFSFTEDWVRLWFSLLCLGNLGWSVAFPHDLVHLSLGFLLLQWLALAMIFERLLRTRQEFGFSLGRYVCSELGLTLYLGWVSAASLVGVVVSAQAVSGSFVSLSTHLALLAVLVVAAVAVLLYLHDVTFALVIVWALAGIAAKDLTPFTPSVREEGLGVQGGARLGALVVGLCVALDLARKLRQHYHARYADADDALPILNDAKDSMDYGTGAV